MIHVEYETQECMIQTVAMRALKECVVRSENLTISIRHPLGL